MQIRRVSPADIAEIQSIYAHHVLHGTGTFEETPPSVEEMQHRLDKITGHGWAWLVATDETKIIGFGYYAHSVIAAHTGVPRKTASTSAKTFAAKASARPSSRPCSPRQRRRDFGR